MTYEEAKNLNIGDYVLYNGLKYKVLHIKEHRSAWTNELFMFIKCKRKDDILQLTNKLAELVT